MHKGLCIFVSDFFVFNSEHTRKHAQTDTYHIHFYIFQKGADVWVYANKTERAEVLQIIIKKEQSTGI